MIIDTHTSMKCRESGVSMIDVLVTLSIASILLGTAASQMSMLTPSLKMSNAKSMWLYDIRRAHVETVKEGCRGVIIPDSDGEGYTFGCDYLPYDVDGTQSLDWSIFRRDLPDDIMLLFEDDILFNSHGQGIDMNGNLVTREVNFWRGGTILNPTTQFATGSLFATGMFMFD